MPGLTIPTGMHVFERGWLSSNNILFTDGNEAVMVDSGYCTHSPQTISLVERVLGNRPLGKLVNTHLHSDHCGGNSELQLRYPAMVTIIPPGQAAQVRDWDPVALSYLPTGQSCPQFQFNDTLQPGTSIQFGTTPWQIHAASGHDPHSVVFFEPDERILISADALWENGFGVVFPELEGITAFSDVGTTLDLIERLNPRVVVPGHGNVFAYSPDVIKLSRQKLDAFITNPVKHARHAAKVLLKFKLLEIQRQPFLEFMRWAEGTPYLLKIRAEFFGNIPTAQWVTSLCEELINAGVAKRDGATIRNM